MSPKMKQVIAQDTEQLSDASNQMDLFEILEKPGSQKRSSHTIELYDALPKYNWEPKREYSLEEAERVRFCSLRDHKERESKRYKVVIRPAVLKRNGKNVLMYPGPREEIIEDALRKLAVSGQGVMGETNAGVVFTLYQLQQELKACGHDLNITQIKEAILICRGATIECYTEDGASILSSSFFSTALLSTRKDWSEKGTGAKCFVDFNPLVTKSIKELSFRQFNYTLSMNINSLLARFIYKRMSHYWTQASASHPYTPSLITFLSQSPRPISERMPENVRAMKNALDTLIQHEVVSHYEANQVKLGRKVTDVRYVIWPHENFVKMVMAANKHKQSLQLAAIKKSLE